ncbi:class I SAM-dependent methyltransferase [Tardiphaga sp. vice304]|uniref:class I SAM-dependent methyltransferase n=1 Tax=Tardiphaga sp. vice304 TaxID=2592817 RepID=UPI00116515F8|nr:class I SAM-dependent methyltransferase [Tardiphaga sp. vice304]QDM28177.1 class I SAM-dependent methyltransferase [Tardiphaga sp. vice304]
MSDQIKAIHRAVGSAHTALIPARRTSRLADLLSVHLPRNANVLDYGSGDGLLASLIMKHRQDVTIVGIDVLKRPTSLIPVEIFDGKTIPHADKSFSAVMIVDVLHHTDDPQSVLREVARVTQGSVIIKDHLADSMLSRPILRCMDWVGNAPYGVRLPYNYLSTKQWDAIFDGAGLSTTSLSKKLNLYPAPLSWVFDRDLHFIANLSVD